MADAYRDALKRSIEGFTATLDRLEASAAMLEKLHLLAPTEY